MESGMILREEGRLLFQTETSLKAAVIIPFK